MEVVPRDVAFASATLTGMNRNRYSLETNGATSARPSNIVTITLPSNALLDMKTFRIKMDLKTTANEATLGTPASGDVYAKLPADVASLISSVEVYIGGVQVDQSCSEMNTVSRILKIVRSSRDRDGSVDRLLSHGAISTDAAIDDVSVVLSDFKGFLGECATRYLPCNQCGDVTIRLTMAPTSVLTYVEQGSSDVLSPGSNFSGAAARAKAAALTYEATNIVATIDTLSFGPAYDMMISQRLQTEEYLPVNYKQMYSFSLHGTTSGAHSVRFSLNCSSVDALYAVFRDTNYLQSGNKMQTYGGASLTDANCANAFFFKSFNGSAAGTYNGKTRGDFRYQFKVASVSYPQYNADILDAAADLSLVTNQVHTHDRGHMITSLEHMQNGCCVIPLILNLPGQDLNVASGYSCKGGNVSFSFDVTGQTPPSVDADAQTTDAISTFVVAETTAQLRIMGARSCSVSF